MSNRPTLQQCQEKLARYVVEERPEDYLTSLDTTQVMGGTLTTLIVFWEGSKGGDVPREVRLVFGLDGKLLMTLVLDPGMFMHATEEGFEIEDADRHATRRLAGFEEVLAYLKGEAYHLADRA